MLLVVIAAPHHVEQAKPMITSGAEQWRKDLLADGVGPRDVLHCAEPSRIILASSAVPGVHHNQGRMAAREFDLRALPTSVTLGRYVAGQVGIELLIIAGRQPERGLGSSVLLTPGARRFLHRGHGADG